MELKRGVAEQHRTELQGKRSEEFGKVRRCNGRASRCGEAQRHCAESKSLATEKFCIGWHWSSIDVTSALQQRSRSAWISNGRRSDGFVRPRKVRQRKREAKRRAVTEKCGDDTSGGAKARH